MISKKKQLRQRKIANRWDRSLLAKRIRVITDPDDRYVPIMSFATLLHQETMEKRLCKELGLSKLTSDVIDTRGATKFGRNPDLNWTSFKTGNGTKITHVVEKINPQLYKDLEPGISGRGVPDQQKKDLVLDTFTPAEMSARWDEVFNAGGDAGVICKVVDPDTLPPFEPGRADIILRDRFMVDRFDPFHGLAPDEFVAKAIDELDKLGKRVHEQWTNRVVNKPVDWELHDDILSTHRAQLIADPAKAITDKPTIKTILATDKKDETK